MEDDADRASIGNFIQALFELCFGQRESVWTFFVDTVVVWQPPRSPEGRSPTRVDIHRGHLDLKGWARSGCKLRSAVASLLTGAGLLDHGHVHILAAMRAIFMGMTSKNKEQVQWFSLQLVWSVGTIIDEHAERLSGEQQPPEILKQKEANQAKSLYKYFMAGRKAFYAPQ